MNDAANATEEYHRRYALVRLGAWYCECCILDLYQIKTTDEAADRRDRLTDDYENDEWGMAPQVWATEREALEYLLHGESGDGKRIIEERLERIAKGEA
jgi:hypothetical protein